MLNSAIRYAQAYAKALPPTILQRLAWVPTRFLLVFFCSLEISGLENLHKVNSNIIIASNHVSELDPLVITASLPFFSRHLPLFFTSREKEFYKNKGWKKYIYGGTLFKLLGSYRAYVGLRNYEKALRHQLEIARIGKSISIFPSGKRVMRGEVIAPKGGVSYLAQATRIPIMPIHIQGAERITLREFLLRKRKIKVVFGQPLYAKDIFRKSTAIMVSDHRNDYEAASAIVMKNIAQLV